MWKKIFYYLALFCVLILAVFIFLDLNQLSLREEKVNINILIANIPEDLDANRTGSYNTVYITNNIFRRLFQITGQLDFEGDLAKAWSVDESKKTILVTLVDEAYFSDGTRITVDDVVSSYSRALLEENASSVMLKGIERVEKLSEHEIIVHYRGWSYVVFQQLSSPFIAVFKSGIIPEKNRKDSWIFSADVEVVKWDDQILKFRWNKRSSNHGELTLVSQVTNAYSKHFPDVMSTRPNWIPTKTIDDISGSTKDKWNRYVFDSFNAGGLYINQRVPKNARNCITNLLRKDREIDGIIGKSRNRSLIPKGMISSNFNEMSVAHESEFVKDGKFENDSISQNKILEIVIRENDIYSPLLPHIKGALSHCGIQHKVIELNRTEYFGRVSQGDFDLAAVSISVLYNDPYMPLSLFRSHSKLNWSRLKSPRLDLLLDQMTTAESEEEYIRFSYRAQEEIVKENVYLPFSTEKISILLKKPLCISAFTLFDVIQWRDLSQKCD